MRFIEIREIYLGGIPELTSLSKDAQSDRAPRDSANIAWQCCQPEDQLEEIGNKTQKKHIKYAFKEGKQLYASLVPTWIAICEQGTNRE